MRNKIKDKEILSLPPNAPPRARQQTKIVSLPSSSSNIVSDIREDQQLMIRMNMRTNSKLGRLTKKFEKSQLTSQFVTNHDNDEKAN